MADEPNQEPLNRFTDAPTTPADRLHDTYQAALQHDNVVPADTAFVLGVVRRTQYGFGGLVDDNWPVLAPPDALLSEFKAKADEVGHNEAWKAINFADQYRAYLKNDDPQQAIQNILDRLQDGQDVWLVCYENTDEKRCHRSLLKQELLSEVPPA
jgi:uncharacterized protein YeaO (DUF488 family)